MNPGACPECGRNYKRREFSTDWLGRVFLTHHVCDPQVVQRYQDSASFPRSQRYSQQRRYAFVCKVCGLPGIGTHSQAMHGECAGEYWKEHDRLRHRSKAS